MAAWAPDPGEDIAVLFCTVLAVLYCDTLRRNASVCYGLPQPGRGRKLLVAKDLFAFWQVSAGQLPKLDVAGSNPVARFNLRQVSFSVAHPVAHACPVV
jgi:hypothetical protein